MNATTWELNKTYLSTNSLSKDFEVIIIKETTAHYTVKVKRTDRYEWKIREIPKDEFLLQRGIDRYQVKYSKLGRALL